LPYSSSSSEKKKEESEHDDGEARKKARKKFMKEGVALAKSYLEEVLGGEVGRQAASTANIEVVLDSRDLLNTRGCLAQCFLDAGCQVIVVVVGDDDSEKPTRNHEEALRLVASLIPLDRICAHFRYEPTSDFFRSVDQAIQSGLCGSVSVQFPVQDSNEPTLMSVFESILGATGVRRDPVPSAPCSVTVHVQADALTSKEVASVCRQVQQLVQQDQERHHYHDQYHHQSISTVALVDPTAKQLGEAYAACLNTDRPDGLFATVVCNRNNEALGLVYSSAESIVASLESGRGVYWSRSRGGLWRKGDSSGHSQTLHLVETDCDGDALRFTVTQNSPDCNADPPAFCHLKTLTCWGMPRGLRMLEMTLRERLRDAPEGSYTKRLFEDDELLRNKLVEEAQELSEAQDPRHVAEELADLLYFSLARAVKAGVSLDDAVVELDKRARKVTRRQGDGKAARIAAADAILQNQKRKEQIPPGSDNDIDNNAK
jgi:phosphoribosyl-ATP pyrophosphohydrolase/phosphoribosyl-AMP cyclohydrolase/histidinol dehydrogenase